MNNYLTGTKFTCYRVSEEISYNTPPLIGEVYELTTTVDRETRGWVEMKSSNGIYKYRLKDMKVINEVKQPLEPLTEPLPSQIKTRLAREKGTTYFEFKIGTVLQELYQNLADKQCESERWPGLKFHSVPSLLQDNNYKNLVRQYGLFDDYGHPLFEGGKFNIAWMRTVGGTGKIKINDQFSLAQLADVMKNTTSFFKVYFEDYYRDICINADINIVL